MTADSQLQDKPEQSEPTIPLEVRVAFSLRDPSVGIRAESPTELGRISVGAEWKPPKPLAHIASAACTAAGGAFREAVKKYNAEQKEKKAAGQRGSKERRKGKMAAGYQSPRPGARARGTGGNRGGRGITEARAEGRRV